MAMKKLLLSLLAFGGMTCISSAQSYYWIDTAYDAITFGDASCSTQGYVLPQNGVNQYVSGTYSQTSNTTSLWEFSGGITLANSYGLLAGCVWDPSVSLPATYVESGMTGCVPPPSTFTAYFGYQLSYNCGGTYGATIDGTVYTGSGDIPAFGWGGITVTITLQSTSGTAPNLHGAYTASFAPTFGGKLGNGTSDTFGLLLQDPVPTGGSWIVG